MNEQNDIPVIPKYQAESQMIHMSRAIKNITIVAVVAFISMLAMALIFVTGYTSRTDKWLNTMAAMQEKPAVTEVNDGIQQQPDP